MMREFRVVTYYRVSTIVQEKKENSIISQKHLCRNFADTKNWKIINEFEEAISGQTLEFRVQLQYVLKMAEKQEFDILLIKDMTRLSRNIKNYLEIEETLHANNIQIIQVDFPTDILDNHFDRKYSDEILISNHIPSFMSKLEINDLVRKTRDGVRQRVKKHKIFNNSPFGYQTKILEENYTQRKIKVINKREKRVIILIYELYLMGWGAFKITKYLNEKKYRTRKEKEFATSSVQTIINNASIYAGYYTYKTIKSKPDTWVTLTPNDIGYEPIISNDKYLQIKEEIKKRSTKNGISREKTIFNKTGIIKCKDCERPAAIILNRSKSRAVCSKAQSGQSCNRNEISIDIIEGRIYRKFKKTFSSKEKITSILSLFLGDSKLSFQTKTNLYDGMKAIEFIIQLIQSDIKFDLQIKTASDMLKLLVDVIFIKKYSSSGKLYNKIEIKYSKLFIQLIKYAELVKEQEEDEEKVIS